MKPSAAPAAFVLLSSLLLLTSLRTIQPARAQNSSAATPGSAFSRRLPQALIIGAKKSGTRALLAFISMHPDVLAPGPEMHFFDRFYHRGLEWYRTRMPPSLPTQLTMEKTPGYFISKSAPARVRAMNPSTRLVLVVRDPVTRMLSDYAQAVANAADAGRRNSRSRRGRRRRQRKRSFGSVKPLESLAFRPRHSAGVNGSSTSDASGVEVASNWSAIRIGEYARHLSNWLAEFPREQILVLSGERLVSDPGSVLEQLQRFLGLEVLITRRHFYFDRRKGFHCQKKAGRAGKPRCLAGDKGRRHPPLSPELTKQLRAFFAPRNRRFYALTGANFGWPEL